MGSQSLSEAGGMLACIVQVAPVPASEDVGRAETKIWNSMEMSALRLQAQEHFQAVGQGDRSVLTVVEESGRCPGHGG